MAIKKIEKRSISEEVLEEFKRLISSGEWKAGEKIPSENELAGIMGVSRVSIRSALEKLKSLGLVESRQGGGTFVCQPDGSQYMNSLLPMAMLGRENQKYVLEYRRLLECEQAALAAERADAEDLQALRENLKRMQDSKGDYTEFSEADLEFHILLAKAGKNPLMIQTSQILRDVILGNIRFARVKRDTEEAFRCHEELVQAIEDGDSSRARRIMEEHMQAAEGYLTEQE